MGESMYTNEYIVLSLVSNGSVLIAMSGVSIIVRKPFDISDIILAIFFWALLIVTQKRLSDKGSKKKIIKQYIYSLTAVTINLL